MRILVAGATGFVGRRVVPRLLEAGHEVLAMTRHPERYDGPGEAIGADVSDPATLPPALAGVDAVVYLVHSLDAPDFVQRDADAARAVASAAADAGVRRIVYLGGLGLDGDDLSDHLQSRRDVERLLAGTGVPVTTLRAGIIVGNGGISWEMTRQLVSHLPVMVTPRWVSTRSQPIAVDDVVAYIIGVLEAEETAGRTFDVGGPAVLTYLDMMKVVADVMGKRRRIILPMPFLSPKISSHWLQFVTDVDATTASSLVESMTNEVVVRDDSITRVLPRELATFDSAVRQALAERAAGLASQRDAAAREKADRKGSWRRAAA